VAHLVFVSVLRSKQMADGMRTTTRSTAEFATGLMIGKIPSNCSELLEIYLPSSFTCWITDGIYSLKNCFRFAGDSTCEFLALFCDAGANEELRVTQMRKERYKQELLSQMAEQKRNKMM